MTTLTALRVAAVVVLAAAMLRGASRARGAARLAERPSGGASSGSAVPDWFAAPAADLGVLPARAWAAWRAAGPVAIVLAVVVGAVWPAVAGVGVVAAPWVLRGPLRRRGERRADEALPGAIDAVVRSLRSGASLPQALADAADTTPGRLGDDLRRMVASTRAGLPLDEALSAWGRRCPRPGVLLVVTALSLAAHTGGASARAVEGVATTLRRRQAAAEETLALSAQARASAAVLAAAPLAVCALAVLNGGRAARFLLATRAGALCLVAGLALDGLGWWWMARLTGRVGRP